MKQILATLLGLLIAQQTFACVQTGPGHDFMICPGDLVFKGSSYSSGAIVEGVNLFHNTVSVKGVSSGELYEEDVRTLDLTKGCLGQVCVGDLVFKGSSYSVGAKVMGINPNTNTVTVQSISSGSNYEESISDLDLTRGCLNEVCVGDKVFKGDSYSSGARVVAINSKSHTVTVISLTSGSNYEENVFDLDLTKGCIYGVCVGDKIFKGSSYSNGASVIGANRFRRTITVQSITSGGLFEEDPRQVDVQTACNNYDDKTRENSLRMP